MNIESATEPQLAGGTSAPAAVSAGDAPMAARPLPPPPSADGGENLSASCPVDNGRADASKGIEKPESSADDLAPVAGVQASPAANPPAGAGRAATLCGEEEELIQKCISVILSEKTASISLIRRRLRLGHTRAVRVMEELERRGIVGPAKGPEPRDILIDFAAGEDANASAGAAASTDPTVPASLAKKDDPHIYVIPAEIVRGNGGGPPLGSGPGGGGSPAMNALRWFYARLSLSDADRPECWDKRGLTARTCELAGLMSNPKSNEQILLEMKDHFPMAVLVESGLWSDAKPPHPPKPNMQFYGYGLRKRGKAGEDDEWGWTHPILIPYFDEAGEVIHLRPHKGGAKDRGIRFFIVRSRKEARSAASPPYQENPSYAVITEGEFKGLALAQALADFGGSVAVATLPGISTSKQLFGDIEDWLSEIAVKTVVVSFDNEDKSDPALPGYNAAAWKRYDCQVWARYLAREVTREGYAGKVAILPNEWRDAKGKADWDGALAMLIRREVEISSERGHTIQSPDGAALSNVIWEAVKERVREEFGKVIRSATEVADQWQFFDTEAERHIKNGLLRISLVPELPVGGEDQKTMARRLRRSSRKMRDKLLPRQCGYLLALAEAYEELQGGYFVFKRLTDKRSDEWMGLRVKGHSDSDTELKRVCEIVLLGKPESISDFVMECHYELIRPNGKRDRLVTLQSRHGRSTKLLSLPSESFAQPSKWREWLLDQGNFTWNAGERELNKLQTDVAKATARMEVELIVMRGWHEPSKLWLYEDVAFTPDGEELLPDKHGIIWHNGAGDRQGYKLSEFDLEGEEFRQGQPKMHPEIGLKHADLVTMLKADKVAFKENAGVAELIELARRESPKGLAELEAVDAQEVMELFMDLALNLHDTLGGLDGFVLLGLLLATGAGPEIFRREAAFPGIWLYGESGAGKGTLARWLLAVWGFSMTGGNASPTILKDSTKVGLSIAMQQYGELHSWLDEFQPDAPEWMVEKIKNIYDRSSGSKKNFDEGRRKMVGPAIVSGIATGGDAQLRSRYAHFHISPKLRLRECQQWFDDNAKQFFRLGRHILRNRKKYAASVLSHLQQWMDGEAMRKVDKRGAKLYGIAYAGFVAMAEVTGLSPRALPSACSMAKLKAHCEMQCVQQVNEVQAKTNVSRFWTDVIAAVESSDLARNASELSKFFKVVVNPYPRRIIPKWQQPPETWCHWQHYVLFMRPDAVVHLVKEFNRKVGIQSQLDRSDLQAQMRTKPYWQPAPPSGEHRQRFSGFKSGKCCWAHDLDFHELGYQDVTEEQWEASFVKYTDAAGNQVRYSSSEWTDPRRGDLFVLVDMLLSKEGPEAES